MEGWFVCCLVCVLRFDCGDGDVGVKTKFCPDVAGFCPGLSRSLSRCVLNLSGCGRLLGSIFRTGAAETGVERVNMGGDSGAEVSLVRRVSVLNQVPRARARFRRGYGSAGGDQVRSGQVWGFVCGDLSGAVGEMDVDCVVELGPLVACGNPGFYPGPPGGEVLLEAFETLFCQFPARGARPELHSGLPGVLGGIFGALLDEPTDGTRRGFHLVPSGSVPGLFVAWRADTWVRALRLGLGR